LKLRSITVFPDKKNGKRYDACRSAIEFSECVAEGEEGRGERHIPFGIENQKPCSKQSHARVPSSDFRGGQNRELSGIHRHSPSLAARVQDSILVSSKPKTPHRCLS